MQKLYSVDKIQKGQEIGSSGDQPKEILMENLQKRQNLN